MKRNQVKEKAGLLLSMDGILLPVVSLILAMIISGIIMAVCGYNPFEAFGAIFAGAFQSQSGLAQTFTQATPLIFTGLAFTLAKKTTLINLGVEGHLLFGAMAAAVLGTVDLGLPIFLHLPLTLIAGMAVGGLFAALVGLLKVKFGSNEVISTIMLNEIAKLFCSYLVNGPFKAEGAVSQTVKVLPTAMLPRIMSKYQLTFAIVLAVLACVAVKFFMERTVKGFEIRCVGLGSVAAETAGINVGRMMIAAMFISGAIAGLAGACHVTGVDRRFIEGFSPGYGFDGIAVAALAGENPIGVIFAGVIFGALRSGAMVLNRTTNIPTDFINVIQALVVILVAAPLLVKEILRAGHFGRKKGEK